MARNGDLGRLFNLPPEQAVSFLDAKVSRESWSWTDVWEKAHEKTFTIAKTLDADVLEDLRSAVESALNNGTPFKQFQKEIEPILKSKGWWGSAIGPDGEVVHLGTPWRLETIFRTNILSSYQAGRQDEMKRVLEKPNSRFKYKKYVAVRDSRTRPTHGQMNGKVFPADHPFWHTHTPPNGFNCRCDVVLLTQRQYEALGSPGLEEGEMKTEEVVLSKKTGKTASVAVYEDKSGKRFPTDPGFSHSPNAKFKPDFDKYKPPVKEQLKKAVSKKQKAEVKDADGWTPPKTFKELKARFEAFYDPGKLRKSAFSIDSKLNFQALKDSLKAVETIYKNHPYLEKLGIISTKKSSFTGKSKNALAHAHYSLFEMNGSQRLWSEGISEFTQGEEWRKTALEGVVKWQEKADWAEQALKDPGLGIVQRGRLQLNLENARENVQVYTRRLQFDRWTYGMSKEREAYNTAVHEFGHILHDQMIEGLNKGVGTMHFNGTRLQRSSSGKTRENLTEQMNKQWVKLFDEVNALASSNPQRFVEIQKNVSQYAFKNNKEFFAETYVMYHNQVQSIDGFVKNFMDALFTNDLDAWEVYLNKRESVK